MRQWERWLAASMIVLVPALAIAAILFSPQPWLQQYSSPKAGSTLLLQIDMKEDKTICSGVNIGGGLVLTAAHCTKGAVSVRLTSDDKKIDGAPAEVLWISEQYDVSLLSAEIQDDVRFTPLSCKPLRIGDPVEVAGNPMGLEFVHTFGHVAQTQRGYEGMYKVGVLIDAVVGPGNSGGPVYRDGYVAGILVGMFGNKQLFGVLTPPTYSVAVPASAVCKLLDKSH